MLVLTRRENEDIVIRVPGRTVPIVVRIASIRGVKVRVGVSCDPEVEVNRREIDDEIRSKVGAGTKA